MDAQRGIARRMVIGLPPDGLSPAWERDFQSFTPAGVILFARDFADLAALRRLTIRLRELARPRRIFIAADEEGGFVSQLAPHLTVPPAAALLARGAEPGDVEWAHRVTAMRLRALGLDWTFAPVADVHSEPANPVIGPRAFGTAPEAVARAVGEALRGLAAGGVASCLKHFPGHGDTELDSHRALPACRADRATLERRELLPFVAHREAPAMMTAHVLYPALDPDGPATFSRAITHDLLRGALGYAGIAISDALEMQGAAAGREPHETARLALEAGCDLALFAFHDEAVRRARLELARALVEGTLDRARFDEARPRLAAFDAAHPPPDAEALATPLEALTPPDWEARLERIAARGLRASGSLPEPAARGAWRVEEPAPPRGTGIASELGALGVPLAESGAAFEVIAIASRVPLEAGAIEALRARCRANPCALVALQADAFLDRVPEAALRISACDATSLTRRVVARELARTRAAAAAARA